MKLVTYSNSDTPAIGALLEDSICPFTNDSSLPNEMKAFLEGGEVNMNKATELLEKAENLIPVDSVTLLSPILNPQKILAIGLLRLTKLCLVTALYSYLYPIYS